MEFTCTQENLLEGLSQVVPVAGRNAQLPILQNILLQVREGVVESETAVRIVLEEARNWTAQKKVVRGLGHTLLEAWSQREWNVICEALPLDSPVRAAFEDFVDKTDGMQLATT